MADLLALRAACSEKEARCVEAYLEHGDAVRAAEHGGYAGGPRELRRATRRVLDRPNPSAYLDALREDALGESKSNVQRVIERLMRIAEGQSVRQAVGRKGSMRDRPAAISAQLKAMELVLRVSGALDPRVELEVDLVINSILEALSRRVSQETYDEALLALQQAFGTGPAAEPTASEEPE